MHNSQDVEQRVEIGGSAWTIAARSAIDIQIEAHELDAVRPPTGVLAVERRPLEGQDMEELHLLRPAATACGETIAVRVPVPACRFGTAEAQVDPIAGATYAWTVEGATILSGNGTPSVLLGFGGAFSAVARVSVTRDGCVSTGAAVLNLRDPLQATISVPDANVGAPVRLTWSYNTSDPILTQILQLPDGAAPIRLAPEARSYTFTPAAEGTKMVKLTAALYRIGARRRAVRSGSGPWASSCSLVEAERPLHVRARCNDPVARVSGGGAACSAATIHANLQGTPPFKGRWSDGVQFETSADRVSRVVTESGIYAIDRFEDATCEGTSTGSVAVEILAPPTGSIVMTPTPVVLTDGGELRITFADASACTITSALGSTVEQPTCSGAGVTRVGFPRLRHSFYDKPGDETITLRLEGPCGEHVATTSFFMCDYLALTKTTQSGEICEGDTFTFTIVASSEVGTPGSPSTTSAGPPFVYRVYRCTLPAAQCTRDAYSLVQEGPSDTFSTSLPGTYTATMTDRLGCPSLFGTAGRTVTVKSCP